MVREEKEVGEVESGPESFAGRDGLEDGANEFGKGTFGPDSVAASKFAAAVGVVDFFGHLKV